ncbi:MAG: dihydroorotate dehydrogenase [Candidatus Adiutrix sp.]
MQKLATTLSGNGHSLHLANPVLTASGTFGYGTEFAPYGELKSLGGIIVKGLSLSPRQGNPMPRIAETRNGMLNAVGLQNCGFDLFVQKKLPALAAFAVPVIVNLYATSSADFAILAKKFNETAGIAALEVNISCPNVKEAGIAFGQNASMAAEVTAAVRKAAPDLPIIVKLSPNVTSIADIARACEDAGANMLSCINTLSAMAVSLQTRKPALANTLGGLSGAGIKPVALRCVWQVCKAIKIPVIGIGGIETAEDVLEFILVGAQAVQVGTANLLRPTAAFDIVKDLPKAMEKHGIADLKAFRGTLQIE